MWHEIITEAVTLFVIIDPIGSASIFLSLTSERAPDESRRIALKSVIVAAVILIAFLFGGLLLLDAMGIPIWAFQVAGGIVLLLFGLNMIFEFAADEKTEGMAAKNDIAVYPLAMPAIAGPGTIMTVVMMIVITFGARLSPS